MARLDAQTAASLRPYSSFLSPHDKSGRREERDAVRAPLLAPARLGRDGGETNKQPQKKKYHYHDNIIEGRPQVQGVAI